METQAKVLRIVAPVLLAAVVIGFLRLSLLVVGAAEELVRVFSLTGIQIIGAVYIPIRLGSDWAPRFTALWLALLLLFAVCQMFYAGGLLLVFWSELWPDHPHLLGELGAAPVGAVDVLSHLWLHVKVWVVALPLLLATAAFGVCSLARRVWGPSSPARSSKLQKPQGPPPGTF